MACNCGTKMSWVATRPNGSTQAYSSESQAAADVRRNGGSYKVVVG